MPQPLSSHPPISPIGQIQPEAEGMRLQLMWPTPVSLLDFRVGAEVRGEDRRMEL